MRIPSVLCVYTLCLIIKRKKISLLSGVWEEPSGTRTLPQGSADADSPQEATPSPAVSVTVEMPTSAVFSADEVLGLLLDTGALSRKETVLCQLQSAKDMIKNSVGTLTQKHLPC